jgi:hypothetical protein
MGWGAFPAVRDDVIRLRGGGGGSREVCPNILYGITVYCFLCGREKLAMGLQGHGSTVHIT